MSTILNNEEKNASGNNKFFVAVIAAVVVIAVLIAVFIFREEEVPVPEFNSQYEEVRKGDMVAELVIKNYGSIKIRLFEGKAPKACENFITHAKEGYYDGLTFHRVINDFMIQGGDPDGDGTGGESIWGEPFEDEFTNDLMPIRGALCMANAGADTNGSQFFIVQCDSYDIKRVINLRENTELDDELIDYYKEVGGAAHLYEAHTVFGQVFEGMDVVDKIAATTTDEDDKPMEAVIIETIKIYQYECD